LQIDRAEGVTKVPSIDVIGIGQMVELMKGVAKLADGLVVIHDLDTFLSLEEERALDEALSDETQH
jgi:purine-binding chemotaxis protein CheW